MNRKDKYNKQNLSDIVSVSGSIREIIYALGLKATGGNYDAVKKYLKLYEIDITHFDPNHGRKKPRKECAIPLEDVLVENSSYSRYSLKARLYKIGLKQRFCEMDGCGQGEEWNGRKMSLILDHKNGVNNDNRIENLRIVCPNCNATLDTHAGKNVKKANKPTVIKPARIYKKGYVVIEKRKVKERPSREELEKLTAEIGYSATGRKFGVSDNAIRKWLK